MCTFRLIYALINFRPTNWTSVFYAEWCYNVWPSGRLAVSELTLKDFIKHYMDRCGAMDKPSQPL